MTSPYLLHPLRSLAEALHDLKRKTGMINNYRWLARTPREGEHPVYICNRCFEEYTVRRNDTPGWCPACVDDVDPRT